MQRKKIQCNADSHLVEKQVIKTFARAYPATWATEEPDLEAQLSDKGININGYVLLKVKKTAAPALAKILAITSETCLLEVFLPKQRSPTSYNSNFVEKGYFGRETILASNICVSVNEEEQTLNISERPTNLIKRLKSDNFLN